MILIEENKKELTNYNISKHAQKRYCERVNGYMDETSVNRFISLHSTEMRERINKLISYGEEVFEGDLRRYKNTTIVRNGNWIIVVSKKDNVVVTLWEKDLGLGKDFNKDYVSKMVGKIQQKNNEKKKIFESNTKEIERIDSTISDNNLKIVELELYLSGLKVANESLFALKENMNINTKGIDMDISDCVDQLLRG